MNYNQAINKIVLCKKCEIRMKFKSAWEDDGHGNAGDCSYYECPKCHKLKFVHLKGDENISYAC